MKVVLVTWYDAFSLDEWHSKAELKAKLLDQPRGALTVTPGIVHEESDEKVVLIQSLQPETEETEESVAGLLIIPKGMVKEVKVLLDD